MRIENVRFFGEDFRFHYGGIVVENGCFEKITVHDAPGPEDAPLMIPGMVDIHLHGNLGVDFSDGDYDTLVGIARFIANAGTTSFSPASMTLSEQTLEKAFRTAVQLRDAQPKSCARIRGITMEGPFFCEKKKGAQNAAYLQPPDYDMFCRLQHASDGMIRIACVAPELDGALDYIRAVSRTGVTVAAAHTNTGYEQAVAGFDAGITHLTHLFNGMPSLLHRQPGLIGAAAERGDITAELICDGIHVHPSAVRAAFKLFGPERICMISDAIPACGLKEGSCLLGGQRIYLHGDRAMLEDGTLAGSIETLFECLRRAIAMGIRAEDALRCSTANPARLLGADDIGVIAEGKRADFLLCTQSFKLLDVYMAGERLERT